jgi:ABC-type glycerol-3-phosphate transport system substrate-binding protein
MKNKVMLILTIILIASFVTSCATPTPQVITKEVVVTKEVPVEKQVVVTKEVTVEKTVEVPVTAKQTRITYWVFAPEGGAKLNDGELWSAFFTRVINKYEDTHPGVMVDVAFRGIEAGGTTTFIDAAVAAGTPPDIYWDSRFRVKKFYDLGLLEDISGALTDADRAAYSPGIFQDSLSKDGKVVWSIPTDAGLWTYAINKTLFEKAGLLDKLPQPPDYTWTTDQFLDACRAINDPPKVYCTAFFAKTPSFDVSFNNFLGGFPDCHFYDFDKQVYTVNSPGCVEAMTFMHTLLDEKLIIPGAPGLVDDDIDPYWKKQQVAMVGGSNWYSSQVKNGLKDGSIKGPFEVMLAMYPNKPGAQPPAVAMGDPHAFSVFKQKDPEKLKIILDFINYMQQPDISSQMAGGWAVLPARQDAPNPFGNDPEQAFYAAAAKKFGSYNFYFNNTAPCNFGEIRQDWAEARQAFWQPGANIQQILDDFVQRADGVVAECPK